jgi:hypothetical protein
MTDITSFKAITITVVIAVVIDELLKSILSLPFFKKGKLTQKNGNE